jgi:hypothetical protein
MNEPREYLPPQQWSAPGPSEPYAPGGHLPAQPPSQWFGPPPGYAPPPGYGPRIDEPASGPGLAAQLGVRIRERPQPRFAISLAAAGMALGVGGGLYWSFGYVAQGFRINFDSDSASTSVSGEGRRFLGAALFVLLAAAGYLTMIVRRRGPLATAGAIGAAIGVPLALIFLSLDLRSSDGVPFNLDLVFVLSVLIWLATYLFVPGARGRAFFLTLAALYLATYVEFKVAKGALTSVVGSSSTSPLGVSVDNFGSGSLTAVALVFGLGYYALAVVLDRRGYAGAAVALVVAGFANTLAGVAYGVLTFKQVGTGVELIVLGVALSWYGGRFGRRFTTWAWAAALVVGIGLVVQKVLPDSPAGGGITLIVLGAVVVAVAQVVARAAHEPPDLDDDRTFAAATGRHH